jgi:hypothetical protein
MRIGGRGDCIPFPNSKSSLTNAPSILQACSKHFPAAKVKRYVKQRDAKTKPGDRKISQLAMNPMANRLANKKSRITERKTR